jgi:hypothetical protein
VESNYLNNSAVSKPAAGDVQFVRVYNNGSALTAYKPYNLVPGWITALGVVYVPIAAATNTAVTNLIGVPQTALAASTYGLIQVGGLVPICATTGTVTANDKLQIINGGVGLIREGSGADGLTIMTTDVCGIAVANVDTNQWQVYLIGALCSIAAS